MKYNEVIEMLYEDLNGKLLLNEELDGMTPLEVDDRGVHLADYVEFA